MSARRGLKDGTTEKQGYTNIMCTTLRKLSDDISGFQYARYQERLSRRPSCCLLSTSPGSPVQNPSVRNFRIQIRQMCGTRDAMKATRCTTHCPPPSQLWTSRATAQKPSGCLLSSRKPSSWLARTLTVFPLCERPLLHATECRHLTLCIHSDLRNATSSDYSERHAVAMEIQRASLTAGFFYSQCFPGLQPRDADSIVCRNDTVKNHGVDENVVQETFAQAEAFFSTSSDVKRSVRGLITIDRSWLIGFHRSISPILTTSGAGWAF